MRVSKPHVGAREIRIEVERLDGCFFRARHHFTWGTVVGGCGVIGFGQGRIQARVLGVVGYASLKVLNRAVDALTRTQAELMKPEKVLVIALQVQVSRYRS